MFNLIRARVEGSERDVGLPTVHRLAISAAASLLRDDQRTRFREEWTAELLAVPPRIRMGFSLSLLAGAHRLAIFARFASPRG